MSKAFRGLLAIAFGIAISAACSIAPRSFRQPLDKITRWWILLGSPAEVTGTDWLRAIEGTQLAILNNDRRLPPGLVANSTIVLAYLSVGEAETGRGYWHAVRGRSFAIEQNHDWPDNVRVDIRDRRWQSILLDEEVPRLLAEGYQGFMLDTLDTAPYLERKDPVRFAGSRQSLGEFLALLRRMFPKAILLANGTETLADAAPFVDGYVTEGIFATYDSAPLRYRKTTSAERDWRLAQVAAALARAWHPIFSIEYAAGAGAPAGLAEWAARQSREHGFHPFVTSKSIDRFPERIVAAGWPDAAYAASLRRRRRLANTIANIIDMPSGGVRPPPAATHPHPE